MKKELEMQLVEKYPEALVDYGKDPRQTCMAWGFECGDGWFEIMKELCEKVGNIPGFRFDQVKEKFGVLTIYYTGPSAEEDRKIVDEAIGEAERKSAITCERCGKPAKLRSDMGWYAVSCKKCEAIYQATKQI
jgi:hypothetical protein